MYRASAWAEKFFPERVSKRLSEAMSRFEPAVDTQVWTLWYLDAFEGFMGKKALSAKRIRRSTLLSIFGMVTIGCTFNLEPTIKALQGEGPDRDMAIILLSFGIIANLFVDWFAQIPTHGFIVFLTHREEVLADLNVEESRKPHPTILAILILLWDIIGKYSFFTIPFILLTIVVDGWYLHWYLAPLIETPVVLLHRNFDPLLDALTTFLYTTFITSTWLWGWFLVLFAAKAISRVILAIPTMKFLLPIDTAPIRSVGLLVALFVGMAYCSVTGIVTLFSEGS